MQHQHTRFSSHCNRAGAAVVDREVILFGEQFRCPFALPWRVHCHVEMKPIDTCGFNLNGLFFDRDTTMHQSQFPLDVLVSV